MSRERVVQVIGETITSAVTVAACHEVVGGQMVPVDVELIAETAADRLQSEGLI